MVSAAHRSVVACFPPLGGGRCEEDLLPEAWIAAWKSLGVVGVFTEVVVVALGTRHGGSGAIGVLADLGESLRL